MNYPELTRKDGIIENNRANAETMFRYLEENKELNMGKGVKRVQWAFQTGELSDQTFRKLFAYYKWVKEGKQKRTN